jgi:CRISP-associated protein Cas1
MTERILDISDRPARLSVRNDLLVLEFPTPSPTTLSPGERADPLDRVRGDAGEDTAASDRRSQTAATEKVARDPDSGLRARDAQAQTVPLADLAVLVVSHPQVSFTHAVLAGIATAGGIFIACNEKHMPAAMMLPLETHSTQAERFARQAGASLPVRKRAWQQIVQAKIRAQACLLLERTGKDWGLGPMAAQVRSGDAGNLEARAARIYWQALFGEDNFRRDPEGEGINPHLNYGYAIVRAIVARALCAAGLHPSFGVHHHNRYDAFCLADDLMEPFRPPVDRVVARLADERGPNPPLDKDAKRILLEGLLGRFTAEGESRTLFDWASRAASSLAGVIEGREEKLCLSLLTPES